MGITTEEKKKPFELRLRNPVIKQEIEDSSASGYYNFFRYGALQRRLDDGWMIKHIHDNQKDHAWILFERETNEI